MGIFTKRIETRSDTSTPGPSDPSTAFDIPTRGANEYSITSGDALGLISVYRAAQIISTSLMQLSLDAYRDGEAIEPKPLLLRRPDFNESLAATLEKLCLSLALNGNFYARVFRDNQGRTTGFRVLNPLDVVIKTDAEGTVTGYQYQGRIWTTDEIRHGALMRVPGYPEGRGPIQAAQAELRGALDTQRYAANWFQESPVPSGILSTDQVLNGDQAGAYGKQWTDSQGGKRGTAVLGNGFKYTPVYLSPEDAQWIEVRQFDVTAIARLFGTPAGLMLASIEGSSQTYSNISQAWTEFARFTLSRYTIEIESFFSDLLPRGTEVKFNLEALLRPDATTRWAIHTQALGSGVLSVNEVREIENLAPIAGGDHKTQAELAEAAAQFVSSPDTPTGSGDTTSEEDADV